MPKVQALYSRVSTDAQRDKGFSIPRQKEWLEDEVKRHNYKNPQHYFKNPQHYTDEGYSAKDTNRPALSRLISDIKDDIVDTVIVYKLDRLARNLQDLLIFMSLLKKHNVNFISITENFDTTTAFGNAMFMLTGVFAQFEREVTAERVKDAMWSKARKGEYTGGQIPFGYNLEHKKLVINKKEAQWVKEIYGKFEELRSLRGVRVWLNSMGYTSKRRRTWASATVRRILTSPLYYGYYTYGKRKGESPVILPRDKWLIVKGDYKPIIPKEQFDNVNAIINGKKYIFPKKKNKEVYILSGLIRCECGGALRAHTVTSKRTGKKWCNYKCHNWASRGKSVCLGNTWKKTYIEHEILQRIRDIAKIHFEETDTQNILRKGDIQKENLERVERRISGLKSKQTKLLKLYEDDRFPKEVLIKRNDEIALKLQELENQRNILKKDIKPKEKQKREKLLQTIMDKDLLSFSDEAKIAVLRQLVKQITVKRTRKIEIELYEL